MKCANSAKSMTSSLLSTKSIQAYVEQLQQQSHRSSTNKIYHSVWQQFSAFFFRLDEKPLSWENRLILFVEHLVESGRKSSTINSYISAIKAVLQKDRVRLREDRFLLNSLVKACRLKNDQIQTRIPIQRDLMEAIVRKLSEVLHDQPFLYLIYRALFCTAYHGLLRIGEVAESMHVIKARDVHLARNKNKLMMILRTSKTHWKDKKPQIIKLSHPQCQLNNAMFCPYQSLRDYIAIRPGFINNAEQFFVFRDRSPVTSSMVRGILRRCLSKLKINPALYNFHGIRAGRATDLLRLGVSVETIKKLGHWKSNAVYVYLR